MRFRRRDFLKLSSAVVLAAGAQQLGRFGDGAAETAKATALSLPVSIQVRFADGHKEMMALDEYIKGVVEAEMATGWPIEALKAQAVAARTYAVKIFKTSGYVSLTSGQAYKTTRHADTGAAVDATRGQVMTYNGTLTLPNYFARCNGATTRDSEHALNWQKGIELGWNYVPYLRARPCSGHSPYSGSSTGYKGHGVGMCQTGARDLANQGMGFRDILARYYTNIQVVSPPSSN